MRSDAVFYEEVLLQKGEVLEHEGRTLTPDMVLGAPRKGLKVTYSTDTRPVPAIVEHAKGADILICEGMYGEKGDINNAVKYKHMTFEEAGKIAAEAKPEVLWLTHYSPALNYPENYIEDVRKIFPNTIAGKDGMWEELRFED